MKKLICLAVALSMIYSLSAPAFAAEYVWSGATNNDAETATNWVGGVKPSAPADTVVYGTGGSISNITNSAYQNTYVTFNRAADFTITASGGGIFGIGGLIAGTDGITAQTPDANNRIYTITALVKLYQNQIWTVSDRAANTTTLLVSDAISQNVAGLGLTKAGTGTLTLSGANTHSGGTTLTLGTLNINSTTALGATAGAFTINGGTIDNSTGAAITNSGNNAITLGGNFSFTGTKDLNLGTGAVTNAGNRTITLNGAASTLTLGGIMTNTQVGLQTTTVNGAGNTLSLGGYALANGALDYIDIINGTGNVTITGAVTNGGTSLASGLTYTGTGTLNLSGNNTYDGLTTMNGADGGGMLTLSGNNSGAAGGVTLTAGILNIDSVTALGTGTFTIGNDTTIDNTSGAAKTLTTTGAQVWSGNFTFRGTNDLNLGTGTVALGAGTRTVVTTAGTLTVGGVISNGAITKDGSGTLTLTGKNTYADATTVTAGKLLLDHDTPASHDYFASNGISIASGATFEIDQTSGNARYSNVSKTVTGAGTFSKTGAGETILANDEDVDNITTFNQSAGGLINVQAGTLSYFKTAATNLGSLTVASGTWAVLDNKQGANSYFDALNGGGNLTYGGGAATARTITLGANGGSGTFSGVISNGGSVAVSFAKTGTGTQTLSGSNTYTGTTTITAGTLQISDPGALGTGVAAHVANNATLSIGTTDLSVGGNYVQTGALKLTANSTAASDYGSIAAGGTGNVAGTISVLVGGYIANGEYLDVVNSTGILTYGATTITLDPSGDQRGSFTGALFGTNTLRLTMNRSANGFASDAANSNESNVANVLDNVTNPTADMTTILTTLSGLNSSQTASALNSMEPDADGAALQVIQSTLDQLTEAILGHQAALRNSPTGVSSGTEMLKGVDVWAQVFGSYLHQDPRQLSQGYNATIWGTALGFDLPIIDLVRIGTCFGFAQDYVRGKDNSNRNDINSYQWTIYGEYAKDAYYIDLSGAFALNTYNASRQVAVGAINRTASADYNGQQYQVYVEAGYTLNCKNLGFDKVTVSKIGKENPSFSLTELNITPLASFQYEHLYLDKYTETGANAMNLTVKAQNYDLAQTGFGVKLDYPFNTKYGQFVPELRFKWLYDWIGDAQATTSNFSGGGGSFATNGFTPAQSSWDFGAKVTMFTKNNWELAANYDFELKEDFYGHYGYVNAKYSF